MGSLITMPVGSRLRKSFVAIGSIVAVGAGLVVAPPSASALVDFGSVSWIAEKGSNPQFPQRAHSSGAVGTAQLLNGVGSNNYFADSITFSPQWSISPGEEMTSYQIWIERCSTPESASCRFRSRTTERLTPGAGPGNYSESHDVDLERFDYGNYFRARILIKTIDARGRRGESSFTSNVRQGYLFAVPQQPFSTVPPFVVDSAGQAVADFDIARDDVKIVLPEWARVEPHSPPYKSSRTVNYWACQEQAGQENTYDWDTSNCTVLSQEVFRTFSARESSEPGSSFSGGVGQYLVIEDKIETTTPSGTIADVTTRSSAYAIINTAAPQQNQPNNQQAGQQGAQAGQQPAQGAQQAEQQAGQADKQAAATGIPTGAAALRLNYSQAPLVSTSGVGTSAGTQLTVRSPAIQKRGKRKKTYRAIIDPKYRGRVAFVLTRTTPQGNMIVAKSKVKNATKSGKAKVRWKFNKKKPAGAYTLYVSFIPRARYGKPGLTVSKSVLLR